jgi:hypothetical protein
MGTVRVKRCSREGVEVERGSAIQDKVTDLDHSQEFDQALVVDLILAQQFGAAPVFRW